VLAPRRVDRALGLRPALRRGEAHPTLRHPTLGRRQGAIALAVQQRGHGRRVGVGEGGWRRAHGRWHPRAPLQASLREPVPGVLALEGAISHQSGGAVGGVPRGPRVLDELAAGWRLTAMAVQWVHAPGKPRALLDHQGPQDVLEVGPMIPTIATRAVHDLCVGGVVAGLAAIDREAGTIERHTLRGQAQTLGGRGRQPTVEGGDAISLERIERPAARIIIARLGCDQPGSQEARGRFVLEQPRHQITWWGHHAEAVADHRVNGLARGHDPRVWRASGGTVNDLTHAECIEHTRDQAHMVADWTPIGLWPGLPLSRGEAIDP